MTLPNYIKTDGKMVDVEFQKLPDSVFMDAVKNRDISKFMILAKGKRKDMAPGAPDVQIVSSTGETKIISRKDLCNNYVFATGKKIRLALLRNNRPYLCVSQCDKPYKVLAVPDNCKGSILSNGNVVQVSPGSVIIVPIKSDGTLDKIHMSVSTMRNFKKGFRVPKQAVLLRHRGQNGARQFTLHNQSENNVNGGSRQRFGRRPTINFGNPASPSMNIGGNTQHQINLEKKEFNTQIRVQPQMTSRPNPNMNVRSNTNMPNRNVKSQPQNNRPNGVDIQNQQKQVQPKYQYTVVNQVLDTKNNQLKGYTLMHLETKKKQVVSPNVLLQLCKQYRVANVEAVQNQNGISYLRGNGIVLKNLPSVLG
jgi:hypothetical protein